jgi:hypothetical protein
MLGGACRLIAAVQLIRDETGALLLALIGAFSCYSVGMTLVRETKSLKPLNAAFSRVR